LAILHSFARIEDGANQPEGHEKAKSVEREKKKKKKRNRDLLIRFSALVKDVLKNSPT